MENTLLQNNKRVRELTMELSKSSKKLSDSKKRTSIGMLKTETSIRHSIASITPMCKNYNSVASMASSVIPEDDRRIFLAAKVENKKIKQLNIPRLDLSKIKNKFENDKVVYVVAKSRPKLHMTTSSKSFNNDLNDIKLKKRPTIKQSLITNI